MTEPALILYGFVPFDRSGRVRWMLHELELPFEFHRLDFHKGESRAPEYLALNPAGKVPTLVDGDVTVFESAAALEYLAARHGAGKVAVPEDAPDRGAYLSWLCFATATLDPTCFELVRPDLDEEEVAPRRARARQELPRMLDAVGRGLGGKETMLARGFTAVDVLLASCLHYADAEDQLEGRPELVSYLERMRARPAAVEAGLFRRPA